MHHRVIAPPLAPALPAHPRLLNWSRWFIGLHPTPSAPVVACALPYRTMKTLWTLVVLCLAPFLASGQGTVNFANRIVGQVDAPIFDVNGTTRLEGTAFKAAFYAGASEASLVQVGEALTFRTGAAAGYLDNSANTVRTITTIPSGGTAYAQVRAWEAAKGSTYEAALAAGGKAGKSAAFTVVTGGGLTPPMPLLNLRSFQLQLSAAPVIVTQPKSTTVGAGATVQFEVTATGTDPLAYQWRKGTTDLSGATGRILELRNVTTANAGSYSVRVSNRYGEKLSSAAELIIAPLPAITDLLVSANPLVGRPLRLEVLVTGTGPFTYVWRRNGADIAGATANVFERSSAEAGTYSVKVTGPGGTVTRDAVTITSQFGLELVPGTGGQITPTPNQTTYAAGTVVTLKAVPDSGYEFTGWAGDLSGTINPSTLSMNGHKRVEASFRAVGGTVYFANRNTGVGIDAPIFDIDGITRLSGEAFLVQLWGGPTEASLAPVGPAVEFRTDDAAGYFTGDIRAIPTVAPGAKGVVQIRAWAAAAGLTYEAAVAAGGKHGASPSLTITVGNLGTPPTLPAQLIGLQSFKLQQGVSPKITSQPVSLTLRAGSKAHFEVTATGSAPLAYQWRKGSTTLPNATSRVFEIAAVTAADAGSYFVRVSNGAGSVDSEPAQLTVSSAPVIASIAVSPGARVGSALRLEAVVQGATPLNFQWRKDGANLSGATAAVYEVAAAQAGTYSLRVTNAGGEAIRDAVTVVARSFLTLSPGAGGHIVVTPEATEVLAPSTHIYPTGTGVTLSADPDPGYQFKSWSGSLSGNVNPANLTLTEDQAIVATFEYIGELGTVDFRNFGGGIDAPVFDVDGVTRLQGSAFLAQLYAAPVGGELAAVGAAKPFRTATAAGYIDSRTDSVRYLPGVRPGGQASLQIRVWEAAKGGTYETARAAQGKAGVSAILTITTGGGLAPPAQPTGLVSFKLTLETPTAPRIVTQPKSVDVALGATARFQVTATGSEPLRYQWKKDGEDLAGKNAAVLEIRNASESDVGVYTVRVSNALGSVESTSARLRVPGFLLETYVASGGHITVTPVRPIYASGAVVNLEAVADPGYVFAGWGGALSGTVNPTSVTMSADRRVEASFRPTGGTVYVINRHLPLDIDAPVYDVDGVTRLAGEGFVAQLYAGPTESTMIAVGGLLPFRTDAAAGYFRSEERSLPNVAPGAKAFLQIRAWELSAGKTFEVAAGQSGKVGMSAVLQLTTGGAGSPPTLPAFPIGLKSFRLQIGSPLHIVTAPTELTVVEGRSASFRVVAEGNPAPSFQWRKGDSNIPGATGSTFEIPVTTRADAGLYSVRVYNAFTETVTTPVALHVLAPPIIVRLIQAPPSPAGESVTVGVVATGSEPLHFEWYVGSSGDTSHPIGTDDATLILPTPSSPTSLWVRVGNEVGRADSEAIQVGPSRRSQTITLGPLPPVVFGLAPTPLFATASSQLPVTFTVLSGPATLAGNLLTPTGAGRVRLRASQAGNADYLPAPDVEEDLTVNKGRATIVLRRMQQAFDGTPKSPEVAVTPPGLRVRLTFGDSASAPSAVGTYAVEAEVDDANYQGSASGTFQILANVNLAGVVFHDLNSDAVRNPSEGGIAGVTVRLLALDGTTELRSTVSDENGRFSFGGLAAGTYYVEEKNLPGYASTTPDQRLVTVASDTVTEVVFGDQPAGTINGLVFEDADGDGTRDDNELGLAGVVVRLTGAGVPRSATTSAEGNFQFTGVSPGSYSVEEIDPANYSSTTPNVRYVSVAAGGSATANFGDQAASTVAGIVFIDANGSGAQDPGENGIAGVEIRLSGSTGTRTRQTSADGSFAFEAVVPGSYSVEETDPVGYTSTTPNVRNVSLASGGSATANFGDQAVGTVAGVVFEDRNGDGSPDPSEPGLPGVIIRLSTATGQRTQTTDSTGAYQFANVAPDSYTLEETDPVGFTSTTPNLRAVTVLNGGSARVNFGDQAAGTVGGVVYQDLDGNGMREASETGLGGVTIRLVGDQGSRTTTTAGDGSYLFTAVDPGSYTVEETDPVGYGSTTPNARTVSVASGGSANASFGDQAAGAISGVVFEDLNGDGTRDVNEPGIGGVAVQWSGQAGTKSTTTAGDGSYQFAGVTPGSYTVIETDPAGFSSTTPNQRTVHLASGGSATAIFGDQATASVSGVVFDDVNGNGRQDAGEGGLGGVIVRLSGGSGEPRSATTTGDGAFVFAEVTPGAYLVTAFTTQGFRSTTLQPQSVAVTTHGAATASFGFAGSISISGVVYADLDGDGRKNGDGTEPGLSGVEIQLTSLAGDGLTRTTTTYGDGAYNFGDLKPGTYLVEETDPSGYVSTTRNLRAVSLTGAEVQTDCQLFNTPTGLSSTCTTSVGVRGIDFGDQREKTISGFVYEDQNGNGIFDHGEPGIGGVAVSLIRTSDSQVVAQTQTDVGGGFVFANVAPGSYEVRQVVPSAYTVLASNGAPPVPSLHGTPEPVSSVGRSVSLADGGAAAVSFANNVLGTLSGMVFNDTDGDGAPGVSESGIGGVEIELRQPDTGNVLATTVTSGSGVYVLANLNPGSYTVGHKPVAGFHSPRTQASVSLSAGAATANFALRAAGTASGRVFNDEDGDGQPDAAESGMGGVKLSLHNLTTGTHVDTVTSADGSFLLTGLPAGQLQIVQVSPDGFHATTPASVTVQLAAGSAASATFGNQSDLVKPPSLTSEPADLVLAEGANGVLTAVATGTEPLVFQWLKNGTPIPGETATSLSILGAKLTDDGQYQVRVSNPLGTVTSRLARVVVSSPDPFNSWLTTQNLPANAKQPSADPDQDGLPNLLEFVLGTSASTPTTTGLPTMVIVAAGEDALFGYEFNRARAASGIRLFLEASTDLAHWGEVPSTLEIVQTSESGDLLRLTDKTPIQFTGHRFLRLGAEAVSRVATPAKLTLISGPPISTTYQMTLEGQPGVTYAVEWSTDLTHWTFLQNVVAGSTAVTVVDNTVSGARYRFYRALAR